MLSTLAADKGGPGRASFSACRELSGSGPEVVLVVLVTRAEGEVDGLPVAEPPDVGAGDVQPLAVALTGLPNEHDDMLIAGEPVVDLQVERPGAALHQLREEANDLVMPLVGAG